MIHPKTLISHQQGKINLRRANIVILFFLIVLGSILTFSACEREEEISIPQNYSDWQRTTTTELDYPIPGHENNYRIIYINKIGEEPIVEEQNGKNRTTFPEGTMIVKEIYQGFDYAPGDEPGMLTIMLKTPEDPRNRGGWVWIVENLAKGTQQIIESEFCITCHANANEEHPYGDNNPNEEFRDYVFFIPRIQ